MKLSELKYITQDDIDQAHINMTSAEMFSEVQDFNTHMLRMQRERRSYLRDFWAMVGLNAVFIALMMSFGLGRKHSLVYHSGSMGLTLCFVMALVYILLFGYFIVFRRIHIWRLGLGLTLPMLLLDPAFIILVLANTYILRKMDQIDSRIRDEAGYPHFVQLNGSYIRDEESAEDGVMDDTAEEYSFDKFRDKSGGPMLIDNDIEEN